MLLIACQTQLYCTPTQKVRLFRRGVPAQADRSLRDEKALFVEVHPAMKTLVFHALALCLLTAVSSAPRTAWSQCCDVVPMCQTLYVPQPVTAFRLEYE